MTVRLRALGALLAVAAALAGCGGPRALTQAEVAGVLIGADEAALRGWTAGTTNEVAPDAGAGPTGPTGPTGPGDNGLGQLLAGASGVSEACRTALTSFSGGLASPTAFASTAFTRQDGSAALGRELVVTLRGYDENPPALPDARAAVAGCPSFDIEAGGQRLSGRLRAPAYDLSDYAALGLDLTSGGEHTSLDLIRLRRGANLVAASVTGADEAANHPLLQDVARAQADKVAATAG